MSGGFNKSGKGEKMKLFTKEGKTFFTGSRFFTGNRLSVNFSFSGKSLKDCIGKHTVTLDSVEVYREKAFNNEATKRLEAVVGEKIEEIAKIGEEEFIRKHFS